MPSQKGGIEMPRIETPMLQRAAADRGFIAA